MRGASGYLLVADGTRGSTVETARLLQARASEALGQLPFVFFINKSDLRNDWEIDDQTITELENLGWRVIKSSAKTGEGVEDGFNQLAEMMCQKKE